MQEMFFLLQHIQVFFKWHLRHSSTHHLVKPCGLLLLAANFYIPNTYFIASQQVQHSLKILLTCSRLTQTEAEKEEKPQNTKTRAICFRVCFSSGRLWRGRFVITDLIKRWMHCSAFPGSELLPASASQALQVNGRKFKLTHSDSQINFQRRTAVQTCGCACVT